MNVVDHDQVSDHAGSDGADFVVPVCRLSGTGGDHVNQFVIGEDVSKHLIVPKVGDLEFMKWRF